jgi:hypothetical protein
MRKKLKFAFTPAKAGVKEVLKRLDSGFRRNDEIRLKKSFSADCQKTKGVGFFIYPEGRK